MGHSVLWKQPLHICFREVFTTSTTENILLLKLLCVTYKYIDRRLIFGKNTKYLKDSYLLILAHVTLKKICDFSEICIFEWIKLQLKVPRWKTAYNIEDIKGWLLLLRLIGIHYNISCLNTWYHIRLQRCINI